MLSIKIKQTLIYDLAHVEQTVPIGSFFLVGEYISHAKWKESRVCGDEELKFNPVTLLSKPRMAVFECVFVADMIYYQAHMVAWASEGPIAVGEIWTGC